MATPEPDLVSLRPSDIAGRRFTVARRGYDLDEVAQFLRALAEYVSRLQGEVEWQRARGEHLERRRACAQDGAYARLSQEFAGLIRTVDEAATSLRGEAEAEAHQILELARQEAEEVLSAARGRARELVMQAKATAERIVQGATLAAVDAAEVAIEQVSHRPYA